MGTLIYGASRVITRVENPKSSDSVVKRFVAVDVDRIDRNALPIRVKDVKVSNKDGALVTIPSALLCKGADNDRIYIMHTSAGLGCTKRAPDPVYPRDAVKKWPCQWTWFTSSVIGMVVNEAPAYVRPTIIGNMDYKDVKSGKLQTPIYLKDVFVDMGGKSTAMGYAVLDRDSKNNLFLLTNSKACDGKPSPSLKRKHDTQYSWVWAPNSDSVHGMLWQPAKVASKDEYMAACGYEPAQHLSHATRVPGEYSITYMAQADAAARVAAMDFSAVEARAMAGMISAEDAATKYGIMGIDYSEKVTRLWEEMAQSTGIPPDLLTKEKDTMGTAAYDKKALVEKLTVAMGVHDKALKDAIAESSKRAHADLDKVLESGGSVVTNDVTMATSLIKVDDYKNMLEELSLIAGDSVKGSDLSRDPIDLIRRAGDIKPLNSRLRMERI